MDRDMRPEEPPEIQEGDNGSLSKVMSKQIQDTQGFTKERKLGKQQLCETVTGQTYSRPHVHQVPQNPALHSEKEEVWARSGASMMEYHL